MRPRPSGGGGAAAGGGGGAPPHRPTAHGPAARPRLPPALDIEVGPAAKRRRSSVPAAASAAAGGSPPPPPPPPLAAALGAGAARLARLAAPRPPGFPPGPAGDAALPLLADPLGFLAEVQRAHGDLVGLSLAGERAVLVADRAAARHVLVDGAADFVKAGTAFFPGSALTGNGLLTSDGAVWRRQRQLAAPAFRRAAVDAYGAAMARAAADLARRRWRGAVGARDVYADFNELTLRITLEALFGADAGGVEGGGGGVEGGGVEGGGGGGGGGDAARAARERASRAEITAAIQAALAHFAARGAAAAALPEAAPTPGNLAFARAVARLDAAVYALIAARRAAHAQAAASGGAARGGGPPPPAPPRRDLLDALLAARDDDGGGMADAALRDELMTFLVAGQETSAIALAWAAAFLAHHPAVQAAAAAEVDAVLAGALPAAADARRLPFLEAVVLEALRLAPPAYLVGRCAPAGAALGGHALPPGTTVLVSPYLLQRDARWWGGGDAAEAARFDPARWLPGADGGPGLAAAALSGMGPHGAYVPFGAGPRVCVGAGFALMEAVLVLAAALQRHALEPLPGAAFPAAAPRITLRPAEVRLVLRRRRGAGGGGH